ncbi:endonuclease V [Nocardioides speluncae]|uniref:endonuclease V n=1 Tax=Nocardioides speluncae TaxID=2670337 RepID=UPI000D68E6D5|nr:endonuclease V [Nocardioides speluncae]
MTADWPATAEEAIAEQLRLRDQVVDAVPDGFASRTAAGFDVHYDGDQAVGAVVVLDLDSLAVVDQAAVRGEVGFPYVPGLFAFRELPLLLPALERLDTAPDVLVCDGQGIAHPRRFGLACHAGVLTGLPSIGVSKSPFGDYAEPGPDRGDWTAITDERWPMGRALRTRAGVKPVFLSIGHLMDIEAATELVLRLTPRFRLPETTRHADRLCRQAHAPAKTGRQIRPNLSTRSAGRAER